MLDSSPSATNRSNPVINPPRDKSIPKAGYDAELDPGGGAATPGEVREPLYPRRGNKGNSEDRLGPGAVAAGVGTIELGDEFLRQALWVRRDRRTWNR